MAVGTSARIVRRRVGALERRIEGHRPPDGMRLPVERCATPSRLVDRDGQKGWQGILERRPQPLRKTLAGGIFKAGKIVQAMMRQQLAVGLPGGVDGRVIRAAHADQHFERVAVQTTALVAQWHMRQEVRGLEPVSAGVNERAACRSLEPPSGRRRQHDRRVRETGESGGETFRNHGIVGIREQGIEIRIVVGCDGRGDGCGQTHLDIGVARHLRRTDVDHKAVAVTAPPTHVRRTAERTGRFKGSACGDQAMRHRRLRRGAHDTPAGPCTPLRRANRQLHPVQHAELVAVRIAQIGEVQLAEVALAHARRALAGCAPGREAGRMPGIRLLR